MTYIGKKRRIVRRPKPQRVAPIKVPDWPTREKADAPLEVPNWPAPVKVPLAPSK